MTIVFLLGLANQQRLRLPGLIQALLRPSNIRIPERSVNEAECLPF
jgi:hypothetical protein